MTKKITVLSPPAMVDDVLFDMTSSTLNSPMREHAHDCIEITITCAGTATHTVDGVAEHLQRGDVFIILPGASHALSDCQRFEHINISCAPDILSRIDINLSFIRGVNDLFPNSRNATSFQLSTTEFNDAKRLLDTMFAAYLRDKEYEKGNLRASFATLMCLFAQAYSRHHNSDPTSGRMDKVVTYIQKHFKEKITLPEVAKIAHLSVSQLVRTFKRNFGTTPIDYIVELRLNEGRRLLKETTLAVSEIAYRTGFNDANYFSRSFKKRFATTPRSQQTSS